MVNDYYPARANLLLKLEPLLYQIVHLCLHCCSTMCSLDITQLWDRGQQIPFTNIIINTDNKRALHWRWYTYCRFALWAQFRRQQHEQWVCESFGARPHSSNGGSFSHPVPDSWSTIMFVGSGIPRIQLVWLSHGLKSDFVQRPQQNQKAWAFSGYT